MMLLYTIVAFGVAWVIQASGFAWFIVCAGGAAAQCLFSYIQTGRGAAPRLAIGVLIIAALPRWIVPVFFGNASQMHVSNSTLEAISWVLSIGCFITATVADVVFTSPVNNDFAGMSRNE